MDDICDISKTFLETLQDTKKAPRKHGLHVKGVKCSFARKEIAFVGHEVTPERVEPLHSKVEALQKWRSCPHIYQP